MIWRIGVTVMPKAGVNDPEGEAILGGLHSLGFSDINQVRAGTEYLLTIDADTEEEARFIASEAADKLLCNSVIQVFEVSQVIAT